MAKGFKACLFLGHLFSFDETSPFTIPRRNENSYLGSSAGAIGTDTESRSSKRYWTRKTLTKQKYVHLVDTLFRNVK